MGRSGKYCPEVASYPLTEEGVALWRVIRQAMPWTGGGFAPLRLDRGEIRARLAGFHPAIIAELADAYEQSALAAMDQAQAAKRLGKPDAPPPRGRRRPEPEESDDG